MKSTSTIPTHEQIRNLLSAARRSDDARTTPAIAFVLGFGCNLGELRTLTWSDFIGWKVIFRDPITGTARSGELTELLVRQCAAIKRTSRNVFAKPQPNSLSLKNLLQLTLKNAGLSSTAIEDLSAWSRLQNASTRIAVITAG